MILIIKHMLLGESKFEAVAPSIQKEAVENTADHPESLQAIEAADFGYERYAGLGGSLSQKQYADVLVRSAEAADSAVNPHARSQAENMARVAGISLKPEIVALYSALRYQRPDQREDYGRLGDQQLLAEALRMGGEDGALDTFMKKYPNIFSPSGAASI